jgi:hypothetical protein
VPTADPPGAADTEEPRVSLRLFVLKHGDTFLVADSFGDICGEGVGLSVTTLASCPASN